MDFIKKHWLISLVVAAIIVVIVIVLVARSTGGSKLAGSTFSFSNPPTVFSGGVEITNGLQVDAGGVNFNGGEINTGSLTSGVSLTQGSLVTQTVSGSFAGTSGSTTLFAFQSPITGTSSVNCDIYGTNATSTTVIEVGTSTAPIVSTFGTSISASLINSTVATSTSFFMKSGLTTGSVGGQTAGSASMADIAINNTDYIIGFATSSSASNNSVVNPSITGVLSTLAGTYTCKFSR